MKNETGTVVSSSCARLGGKHWCRGVPGTSDLISGFSYVLNTPSSDRKPSLVKVTFRIAKSSARCAVHVGPCGSAAYFLLGTLFTCLPGNHILSWNSSCFCGFYYLLCWILFFFFPQTSPCYRIPGLNLWALHSSLEDLIPSHGFKQSIYIYIWPIYIYGSYIYILYIYCI